MISYRIEINDRNIKAKNFLQFINDYAKDNKFISIEKTSNKIIKKNKVIDSKSEWDNALSPRAFRKEVKAMLKNKFDENKILKASN